MITKLVRSVLSLLVVITLMIPAAHGVSEQTAKMGESKKDAQAFVQTASTLVGKKKEDVIIAIGLPDSAGNADRIEFWKYRKLFGDYRRRRGIFGHISLSWEVRLDLIFKDGVVLSAKPSAIREVHRERGEETQ